MPHDNILFFAVTERTQLRQSALVPGSLLYIELTALEGPSVRETGQSLADGPELLLPLLELSVVFKVCGG